MVKRYGKELGIFTLLLVLCVFLAIMNPRFISGINLQNTARLIGMYGIFSLGMGFVIITGGIDLSVGSLIALLGVLLSILLVDSHMAPVIALIAVLAIGAVAGGVHSLLITRARLQPFIVTLCGLLIYRGLSRYISRDETKGFGSEGFGGLKEFATGNLLGIPVPFVLLIVIAVVLWVVLHRSVYGRYLYAVGRNEEAARFSGVNTKRIEGAAYVICSILAAISAVLFAFYTNSVSPSTHGNFYELYGIAAAVVGGCSLRGGEGSIIGILLGVALLQVLQNLVNLLGIPSSLNFAVMGAVILLGVLADRMLRK
ncbi:MAG TPA: ABC transporter permease [Fimbriimonas sp.]|nr:ABC transporter permease [Fimbriimonas sp.]